MQFGRTLSLTAGTLLTAAVGASAQDSDWTQFRGPLRDGTAVLLPLSAGWPEAGPPELWRRPLGSGFSTVASVGDRLYTLAASDEFEEVFCLDASTGETVWQVPLGPRFEEQFGDGPRSTPAVDGDTLFAVTSTMEMAALATDDGEVRWKHDLKEKFSIKSPRFGFSPSPIVVGDYVILEVGGGDGRGVVAFERETGEIAWSALDGPAGPSSPVLIELDGVPQLVFSRPALPGMVALSLDGEVLWSETGAADVMVMPQFIAPDRFFTSSAKMGKGGVMLRVSQVDGDTSVEALWANRRFRNHFNNSVVVKGHLYGFDNSTLRCVSVETGETVWSERGFGKGSLIACGNLLFVLGDQGVAALVAADPEAYTERGRVQAMEGRCWTSPTLASGRLLLRNLEEIVAYNVSGDELLAASDRAVSAVDSSPAVASGSSAPSVDEIVAHYVEARGGLERWREVESLVLRGTFSAFSESSPFTFARLRDEFYRFEFGMIGQRDARGRDEEGAWWCYNLFGITDAARVAMEPYHTQLKREAMFEPALLDAEGHEVSVEWIGVGEVDGKATYDLRLTFADGSVETWMLDPASGLEVAIDSTVVDFTQSQEPMNCRTFFRDFREVDGLVLPFHVAAEFGARLEEMSVAEAILDPEESEAATEAFFRMPPLAERAGDGE